MILVTGSDGQLGSSLRSVLKSEALFLNSSELDITKIDNIKAVVDGCNPSCIVNCAAYTNVEKAESDSERAFDVNEGGVRNLAVVCEMNKIRLIHISTDYVFDGQKSIPYTEEDIPNPINIYGKSKLAGERAILDTSCDAIIIRTSWLYSVSEDNFVSKVLNMLKTKDVLNIVYDQIGSPTFSDDLARCISVFIDGHKVKGQHIFHYSNEGVASWYDFACYISKLSGLYKPIRPIRSSMFPTEADRPSFTLLSKDKIKSVMFVDINHWSRSLELCLSMKILNR